MTRAQWILICRFMHAVLLYMSKRDQNKGLGSFDYGQLTADIHESITSEAPHA